MTMTQARPDLTRPTTLISAAGPSYFPIAFLARLPFAMMVVGVLTLVVSARGSLSLGGLTSAAVGLGTALIGPLQGMLADRIGQRRVLLASGISTSAAMLALSWVAFSSMPDTAVLATAFVVGATGPQVSPMSRSRLVGLITAHLPVRRRQQVLSGTMAYESAADEIMFVFGPVIVGLLASTLGPAAPVIGSAILTLFFVTAFALHRTGSDVASPSVPGAGVQAPASELLRPQLITVVAGVFGMGLFFGSTLTALTSFMSGLGHPERAGLIYGAMGIGSAALALGAGLFPARFALHARWLVFSAVLSVGAAGIMIAGSVPVMVMMLLVAGVGIGPTLVTMFNLGATLSPLGRSTTVMTILGSAVTVGQSAAAAINGRLAETFGPHVAAVAPLVSSAVIVAAATVNRRLSARSASPAR